MSAITYPAAIPPLSVSTQAVYLRTAWGNTWTSAGSLYCTRLAFSTGETLSAASFYWRFGTLIGTGAVPVLSINPLSYVRVDVTGTDGRANYTWYGVWRTATKRDVHQEFQAVGLEQLLDEPCVDSPYWDGASVRWAGRAVEFNAGGLPNRSSAKHTVNGVQAYTFDRAGSDYWSTRDAVELLLACAAPKNPAGSVIFNWTPQNLAALPDFDQLRQDPHGTSFLALIRALVPRQRLVGWCVERGSGNLVNVRFFTFSEADIDLDDPDGDPVGTIPENTDQDTIDVSADTSATSTLSTEAAAVVDQVIATGGRRRSVFTISGTDDTVAKLWTDLMQAEYHLGAAMAADYPPATEPRLREERDRQARADQALRGTYSWVGPESDWDQLAGDGEAGITHPDDYEPICVDDAGDQFLVYEPLLRFDSVLPLQTGYDHSQAKISDREADEGYHAEEIAGEAHEPIACFAALLAVPDTADPSSVNRWVLADQMGRAADLEHVDSHSARRWSLDVKPLEGTGGLELRVQGEQQHVLSVIEIPSLLLIPGAVAWQTIVLTVSIQDPRDVEVRYPADGDVTAYGELLRRMRIEAPEAQLVRVLPNTVVGVDRDTQELLRTDGGILLDDRPYLRLLAQRTYEWHKAPRYALSYSTNWIDGAVKIGHLVTAVTDAAGTYPVNSVITEITMDFGVAQSRNPPLPSCTVATSFAELDVRFGL